MIFFNIISFIKIIFINGFSYKIQIWNYSLVWFLRNLNFRIITPVDKVLFIRRTPEHRFSFILLRFFIILFFTYIMRYKISFICCSKFHISYLFAFIIKIHGNYRQSLIIMFMRKFTLITSLLSLFCFEIKHHFRTFTFSTQTFTT